MYLAMDTETGGIDPLHHSLLTVCLVVTDNRLNEIAVREWAIAHSTYSVSNEALRVNGINLVNHHAEGLPIATVGMQMGEWLQQHSNGEKFTPLGWNVAFDVAFIKQIPLDWGSLLRYSVLDVQSINQMKHIKHGTAVGSLHSTAAQYELNVSGAHTARADVLLTLSVLRHLIDTV